jgi:xylan 1,4-beta-xylosidase
VDFVSTHTYGSPPLDLRPILARHDREDARIWWTEWGPGSQHFHLVGDSVFAATFLLDGMASAMGRLDALSHWVASDHFEELGRPEKLGHGGFGLLTVGNLRKPRWWALALMNRLGDSRLGVAAEGDGADGLVSTVAARSDDGEIGVLVWNSSLDQSRIPFDALLARDVTVTLADLPAGPATIRHWRVDEEYSNVFAAWRDLGGAERDWPEGEEEWERLREADHLVELEPRTVDVGDDGLLSVSFPLPQPGISFLSVRTGPVPAGD